MFGALEVGLHRPLHIREEWLSGRTDVCRLLYVSDIHLRAGRSETLCRQVLDVVADCHPDLVLLGGDLVDGFSELASLGVLVRRLSDIATVLAIGGNHDRRVGLARVREAVEQSGGLWIHDGTARVTHRNRAIVISGPDAASTDDGDVRVLCAHNPRVWKAAQLAGYELVLAGHLHGCQIVGWKYQDRLFPGALFYRYCFLSHHCGSTRLVVSRGVSDLVPIRWRCPREVVLCYV